MASKIPNSHSWDIQKHNHLLLTVIKNKNTFLVISLSPWDCSENTCAALTHSGRGYGHFCHVYILSVVIFYLFTAVIWNHPIVSGLSRTLLRASPLHYGSLWTATSEMCDGQTAPSFAGAQIHWAYSNPKENRKTNDRMKWLTWRSWINTHPFPSLPGGVRLAQHCTGPRSCPGCHPSHQQVRDCPI